MATYFYTKNDNGDMQIDDNYEAIVSIKSGTVQANINNGQLYGLVLTSPAHCVGFYIDSGELFISPAVPYGDTFVVYVAADSNTTIHYEMLARCTSLSKAEHLAGMEIYNASGKLLFSTQYRTFSAYLGKYARYASTTSIPLINGNTMVIQPGSDPEADMLYLLEALTGYAASSDSGAAVAMDALYKACISYATGVEAWSVDVPSGSLVASTTEPWFPSYETTVGAETKAIYTAGYKFSANGTKISIGQKMQKFYANSLLGGGTLQDINRTIRTWEYRGNTISEQYGISSHGYIFNIFKPL